MFAAVVPLYHQQIKVRLAPVQPRSLKSWDAKHTVNTARLDTSLKCGWNFLLFRVKERCFQPFFYLQFLTAISRWWRVGVVYLFWILGSSQCLLIGGSLVRFPWSACRSVLGPDTEPQITPSPFGQKHLLNVKTRILFCYKWRLKRLFEPTACRNTL